MSSAGAGAIEMNQSVSSAYLNRRPTRSAPTQSITKLANSNVLDALTTAAANAVASSNNNNNHNSSILNSNNNQFNHHSQSNHNNSILSVRENNNNINTNSSGNLSSHQFANINNDQIVYCDPKTGEVESRVERAILEAENPLNFNDQEEITLSNNERALWINKEENLGWRGPMPLDQYRLNVDPNPNVIVKKPKEKIKYKQEVHVKYLKPPTPKPSELVIVQEPNRQLPAAPPLIIRQAAPRQPTPEPIIIREAPPYIPEPIRRVVHVPGKLLPAPARKVIVERLPSAPPKPQQVIIERWLKPRIPAPRIIVCKPVDRPQIEYHHHPQCPPGCQPCYECPPGCEPSLMDNSFSHHIHHQPDRNDIVISIFLE